LSREKIRRNRLAKQPEKKTKKKKINERRERENEILKKYHIFNDTHLDVKLSVR